MKNSGMTYGFELENLEPRIMLSADPVVAAADAVAPDTPEFSDTNPVPPLVEATTHDGANTTEPAPEDQALAYDPADNLTDIFSASTDTESESTPDDQGVQEDDYPRNPTETDAEFFDSDPFSDEPTDAQTDDPSDESQVVNGPSDSSDNDPSAVPSDPLETLTGDTFSGDSGEAPAADASMESTSDPEVIWVDRLITEGEQTAILDGMTGLARFGGLLDQFDVMGEPVDGVEETSPGQLLGTHALLDTRLTRPVYKYFSDAVDPPSTDGLVDALNEASEVVITGGYNFDSDEFRFAVSLTANRTGVLRAAAAVPESGETDSAVQDITYVAEIQFNFVFGVQRADGSDGFFITVENLSATFDFESSASDQTVGQMLPEGSDADTASGLPAAEPIDDSDQASGTGDADTASASDATPSQISDSVLDPDYRLTILFDETIAGDGRITLTELVSITSENMGSYVLLVPAGMIAVAPSGDDSQTETPVDGSGNVPGIGTPDDGTGSPAVGESTLADLSVDDPSTGAGLDVAPEVSVDASVPATDFSDASDISELKASIIDLLQGFDTVGDAMADSGVFDMPLSGIDASIDSLLSDDPDAGVGDLLDVTTAANEYFTLSEVFGLDVTAHLTDLGSLPGIDIPDFQLEDPAHMGALKSLLEDTHDLTLTPDWDLTLYLPEIWSLLNPGFEISDYLPQVQTLLGMPYVPVVNEVRSDLKSAFGTAPSIEGLVDYIQTTRLDPVSTGFGDGSADSPLVITGAYDPDSRTVQLDLVIDAVRQVDVAVDLAALTSDPLDAANVVGTTDLTVAATLSLNFAISARGSPDAAYLTVQEAAVAVRINENLFDLGATSEPIAATSLGSPAGQFEFDARVEFVFHGLDPPAESTLSIADLRVTPLPENFVAIQTSGTFSLEFQITDSSSRQLVIHAASDNVFDPTRTTVQVDEAAADSTLTHQQVTATLEAAKAQWSALPLSSDQSARLDAIETRITELSGFTLSETAGYLITVDSNAAGFGWFVDDTPGFDEEFVFTDAVHLTATAGSAAADRIDLLTVLMHEVGHVLGLGHDAPLAIMDEMFYASQRIKISAAELYAANPAGGLPVDDASHTGTTLDLSDAANNGENITVTVLSNGNLEVSGSQTGDDNTSGGWAGLTTIVGNPDANITLIAPDLDNVWDLTGINAGALTPDSLSVFTFSDVQSLTGGSQKDVFSIDELAGVTGSLDDGLGTLEIQLFDFFYISGDFSFENKNGDLKLNNDTDFIGVDYLLLGAENVDAFVGTNGPYVDGTVTPDALGLSLTGTDVSLLLFADASGASPILYTALKASFDSAALVGVPDLVINASGTVSLNHTSDGTNPNTVLDFDDGAGDSVAGIPVTPAAAGAPTIDFEGENGALLDTTASVSLDVYGFVVGTATLKMTQATTNVTTNNSAIGTAGTLNGAAVLKLELSGLDLFAGVGASLDEGGAGIGDDTVDTGGAIGFSITGGTINFAVVRPAGQAADDLASFAGLELNLLGASLVGIDGLVFTADGSVLVNRATDATGAVSSDRIDWANATDTGSILPTFGAGLTSSIELRISGAASIDVFGFVVGTVDEFVMTTGTSTVTTGNAAIGTAGTLTNASVMSVTLTGLDLFAGVGASLDEGGAGLADDTVDTDGAIGFAILGGSINFASVRPAGLGVGDLTAFTGIEIELAGAQLVGIDGLIFKAEGSVLVNKATDGAGLDTTDRIDWANATDTGSILPTFGAGLTSSIELRISGAASIDVFGFVVGTVDEFVMTTGTSTVTTGNAAIGTAGTLTNASVMSVTLTGLDLFAGVGASLDEGGAGLADDTVDTDGAIGFAILGGSINFASVRPAGLGVGDLTAFTGIEIELAGAQLVGIDGVDL